MTTATVSAPASGPPRDVPAAQQYRWVGACVHASDDAVILQVGKSMTSLRPDEAKQFLRWMARAYFKAEEANVRTIVEAQR